jgi:superfamily II DNA/RNA helicase
MTLTSDAPEARAHTLSFDALGVPAPLVASLAQGGITAPFPIQAATLVDSLAGRDVLGRGKTGSGKTVAFSLPLVAALAASGARREPNRPRGLVLVPTRELANQVADTLIPLAAAMKMKVTTIFGGVGQGNQVAALRAGVDIVVACPGRLEDLIGQRHCRLDGVQVTVLDEADHMADLGFLPGVKRIMDLTPRGTQRLLFSATLDNGVDILVKRYMNNPVTHSVDPAVAPVSTMTHHVLAVSRDNKPAVVQALASGQERSLLFTRTKHTAKKIAKQLTMNGIPAVELHGNLSQGARERNLAAFADGSSRVLVATDIAARGIHVDDIALVVHVDPPAEHKAYLHRSGRTARAGAEGVVVTVMTPDQRNDVRQLAKQARIEPTITHVEPGHERLLELTGPHAEKVTPRPQPAAPVQAPRKPRKPVQVNANGEVARPRPARPNGGRPNGGRPQGGRPGGSGQARRSSGAGGSGQGRPAGSGQARRSSGSGTSGGRRGTAASGR